MMFTYTVVKTMVLNARVIVLYDFYIFSHDVNNLTYKLILLVIY